MDGWTIFYDDESLVMWNFTPPNHPAHPAAVKRMLWEEHGELLQEMRVLCQAGKDACDELVADFQELNDQMREYMRRKSENDQTQWAPSAQQRSRADETLSRFLLAIDEARYRVAYGLLTPGMKSLMTSAEFVENEQYLHGQFGGRPVRSNIRVTWYKDPPQSQGPGVYAAFDITCRYRNINICAEVVILHEQDSGAFLMMRHERNFVEKDSEAKFLELQRQRKNQ